MKKETWQGEQSGFWPHDELSFMGNWPWILGALCPWMACLLRDAIFTSLIQWPHSQQTLGQSLTAELPTLATAMRSAPPTGEGTGEWEYLAKDGRCTKSRCKMLIIKINNKSLTRWFRGVADQNICDIFDYLVPSLFISHYLIYLSHWAKC